MGNDSRRLRWRCRRGMRELDAVLEAFVDKHLATLDGAEMSRLEAILDLPDPELYGYLVHGMEPRDHQVAALIERIRGSLHPEASEVA